VRAVEESNHNPILRRYLAECRKRQIILSSPIDRDFPVGYRIRGMLSEEPFLSVLQLSSPFPSSHTESRKVNQVQRTTTLLTLLQSVKHKTYVFHCQTGSAIVSLHTDWSQQFRPIDDELETTTWRVTHHDTVRRPCLGVWAMQRHK
jgi:hypothetical protein